MVRNEKKALNELTREELEYLLKECRASLARRQAAKNGVLATIDKESGTIESLISILLTFTPDQMAAFVAGAREIITQYK